jgi:hypothetical protein
MDNRHSNLNDKSTVINVNPSQEKLLKQASGMGSSMMNVTRMAPSIWSPVLQLASLLLPKTIEEKNIWRRWYYQHDPVVGTAIDLHTRYPISKFRLRCEGDDSSEVSEEYEAIAKEAKLLEFMNWIGQEWYCVGEAFPAGIWDKERLCWSSFTLMNPDFMDVQVNPFNIDEKFVSIVKWSKPLKDIVTKGNSDPRTAPVYQSMLRYQSDVVKAITDNAPFMLSNNIVSHIARRSSYFDLRGSSIIDRLFKVLMYQEKLMEAQLAGASRYATPIEKWTIGNDMEPASQTALDKLEQVIRTTWNSPQKAVIWNHTLQGEMIGGTGNLLASTPEMEWITKQKSAALMINESIINASGPTYASASVAADYMTAFYMNYRMGLEDWGRDHFFTQIAKAREYYKPIKRQIVGHYRDKIVKRELMLPDFMWDRANLQDDQQKLQQFIGLAEQGRLPWEIVYDYMNLDMDTMLKKLKNEAKLFAEIAPGGGLGQQSGQLPGLEGALGMGGELPPGGDMSGLGGGDINAMPTTGAESIGGMGMPAQSMGQPSTGTQGTGV